MNFQSSYSVSAPMRPHTHQASQEKQNDLNMSIIGILSYALSNSLNSYHKLLKQRGILQPKEPSILPQKAQTTKTLRCDSHFKQNINIIQGRTSFAQTKNTSKKYFYEAAQQKLDEKLLKNPSLKTVHSFSDATKQNLNPLKTKAKDITMPQKDKKEHVRPAVLIDSMEQANVVKMGMKSQDRNRILQNLLMRQVTGWPIKTRPLGTKREVRSLLS